MPAGRANNHVLAGFGAGANMIEDTVRRREVEHTIEPG